MNGLDKSSTRGLFRVSGRPVSFLSIIYLIQSAAIFLFNAPPLLIRH